jgi:hypothetical protein
MFAASYAQNIALCLVLISIQRFKLVRCGFGVVLVQHNRPIAYSKYVKPGGSARGLPNASTGKLISSSWDYIYF